MHHTIFDTPVVNTLLRAGSRIFLRVNGWTVEGSLPPEAAKSVLIAAPHTSNWDLPYTLMVAFVLRWLGGIAVDRDKSSNLVAASAEAIVRADGPVQLVVPPEGTRGKTRHWKTGFYFIALQARVPIVLAYMDYERKVSGLGPIFKPTGDVDADMVEIKRFYAPIKGRCADLFGTN